MENMPIVKPQVLGVNPLRPALIRPSSGEEPGQGAPATKLTQCSPNVLQALVCGGQMN